MRVTTFTSDRKYKIDERTNNIFAVPVLIEGDLLQMLLQKTPGRVGAPTDFTFSFTTLNTIQAGGTVRIEFEDDSL